MLEPSASDQGAEALLRAVTTKFPDSRQQLSAGGGSRELALLLQALEGQQTLLTIGCSSNDHQQGRFLRSKLASHRSPIMPRST